MCSFPRPTPFTETIFAVRWYFRLSRVCLPDTSRGCRLPTPHIRPFVCCGRLRQGVFRQGSTRLHLGTVGRRTGVLSGYCLQRNDTRLTAVFDRFWPCRRICHHSLALDSSRSDWLNRVDRGGTRRTRCILSAAIVVCVPSADSAGAGGVSAGVRQSVCDGRVRPGRPSIPCSTVCRPPVPVQWPPRGDRHGGPHRSVRPILSVTGESGRLLVCRLVPSPTERSWRGGELDAAPGAARRRVDGLH